MKRITVLFDDERLYREVKAEAAREGRTMKEVVAEALASWLSGRPGTPAELREPRLAALDALEEIAVPNRGASIGQTLSELRRERS